MRSRAEPPLRSPCRASRCGACRRASRRKAVVEPAVAEPAAEPPPRNAIPKRLCGPPSWPMPPSPARSITKSPIAPNSTEYFVHAAFDGASSARVTHSPCIRRRPPKHRSPSGQRCRLRHRRPRSTCHRHHPHRHGPCVCRPCCRRGRPPRSRLGPCLLRPLTCRRHRRQCSAASSPPLPASARRSQSPPNRSVLPTTRPCARCGLELSAKVAFCRRCGTRQTRSAAARLDVVAVSVDSRNRSRRKRAQAAPHSSIWKLRFSQTNAPKTAASTPNAARPPTSSGASTVKRLVSRPIATPASDDRQPGFVPGRRSGGDQSEGQPDRQRCTAG